MSERVGSPDERSGDGGSAMVTLSTLADGSGSKLFALSGLVPLDERLSWVPPGLEGFQPINLYVAVELERALLIDSGVALHETGVLRELRRLLAPVAELEILLTRAEPDCIGNVAAIARNFTVSCAYAVGRLNPFDAFDLVSEPDANGSRAEVTLNRIESGQTIEISPSRSVKLHMPLLRVLLTSWAYDAATKTLFTSDSFSYLALDRESDSVVVNSIGAVDADELARRMLVKFAWLAGAVSIERVRADLRAVFEENDVEVIAPTRGCILRGSGAVSEYHELTQDVLAAVGGFANASPTTRR